LRKSSNADCNVLFLHRHSDQFLLWGLRNEAPYILRRNGEAKGVEVLGWVIFKPRPHWLATI